MNKTYLYVGIGAVVLIGGFLLYKKMKTDSSSEGETSAEEGASTEGGASTESGNKTKEGSTTTRPEQSPISGDSKIMRDDKIMIEAYDKAKSIYPATTLEARSKRQLYAKTYGVQRKVDWDAWKARREAEGQTFESTPENVAITTSSSPTGNVQTQITTVTNPDGTQTVRVSAIPKKKTSNRNTGMGGTTFATPNFSDDGEEFAFNGHTF
jgi:hypothetical protein